MNDSFGAFMTICSLLVANASVAFCGSIITALSTAYALGLPLFAVSGVDTGQALNPALPGAGWRAIGLCMVAVFLLATTLNLLLCSYMVANRPLAQRYALISSVLPTVISGLAGIVVLSH